jgi:hypothetical protein
VHLASSDGLAIVTNVPAKFQFVMPFPTERQESSSTIRSVHLAIGAGLVLLMAIGFVADGGTGRVVELVVVAAAIAGGYAAGPARSRLVAVAAGALILLVEALAGRLAGTHAPLALWFALATAGTVVVSGRLRPAPEPWGRSERPQPGSLEHEFRRSVRHQRPFSLLVVHPDGRGADVTAVVERIVAGLRSTDIAAGRDGRDLWLLLPETGSDSARVAAERLRLAAGAAGRTVSIGVASFPDDGLSAANLAGAASRALSRALELGGNRTVLQTAPDDGPPGWGVVSVA